MTDRELLKLAAKAAGIQLNNAAMQTMYMGDDGQWVFWNPLLDDGDALRLAVSLGLSLAPGYAGFVRILYQCAEKRKDNVSECVHVKSDPYDAMRLAIVRAAAEIGKAMP